jgi:hypothetical protein
LPPVPGVPVYLTLGIVLTARGYDSIGWIYSVLFSTAVGTLLKLFSSALQQKLIGENLSHFVKIRQFVGINSQLMKAMRLVVGQSGFSVAKVAILIGGPDWPVRVIFTLRPSQSPILTKSKTCVDICFVWNHETVTRPDYDWYTSDCLSDLSNMPDGCSDLLG